MSTLQDVLSSIRKERPRRIVVFTGAGISAESGIPTFRGSGGLWKSFQAEDLATPDAFARDPELVWEWYEWRRGLIRTAQPNAAHTAIARLEREAAGRGEVMVVTQNVDGLHALAGSRNLIELHGNIFRARCMREQSTRDFFEPASEIPPRCQCGAMLRPDVVWFGEMLPPGAMERATEAVASSDLLLVVGTSGLVYPAAGLVGIAGRMSVEINMQSTPLTAICTHSIAGSAAAAVPPIAEALQEVMR
jgi:NAD-dependent deacetylase